MFVPISTERMNDKLTRERIANSIEHNGDYEA
jgi:hypothetical protein